MAQSTKRPNAFVVKNASSQKLGKANSIVADAARKGALRCIGDICFNKDGVIEVKLKRQHCPPEVLDTLVKRTFKGAKTEYVIENE